MVKCLCNITKTKQRPIKRAGRIFWRNYCTLRRVIYIKLHTGSSVCARKSTNFKRMPNRKSEQQSTSSEALTPCVSLLPNQVSGVPPQEQIPYNPRPNHHWARPCQQETPQTQSLHSGTHLEFQRAQACPPIEKDLLPPVNCGAVIKWFAVCGACKSWWDTGQTVGARQ